MNRMHVRTVLVFVAAAVLARADVTLRYSFEVKPGEMVTRGAPELAKQTTKTPPTFLYLKGDRALIDMGSVHSISDFHGQLITFVDAKHARYATVQKDEYERLMLKDYEDEKSKRDLRNRLEGMKVKAESTGRSRTIQDVQAEERRVTVEAQMPDMTPIGVRGIFSLWVPRPEEISRHPALNELRLFGERAYIGTDPTAATRSALQNTGFAPLESALMAALKDAPVVLRMEISMLVRGFPIAVEDGPKPDEYVQMAEMILSLDELSTAKVADFVFDVPREFTVVTMKELLDGVTAE